MLTIWSALEIIKDLPTMLQMQFHQLMLMILALIRRRHSSLSLTIDIGITIEITTQPQRAPLWESNNMCGIKIEGTSYKVAMMSANSTTIAAAARPIDNELVACVVQSSIKQSTRFNR
jgi:hypothetical protein